jgi:hypothetical protein
MSYRRGNQNSQQFQPRQTLIDSSDTYLKSCGSSLVEITKHLKDTYKTGGFDKSILTGWDNRILILAKSLATTRHKLSASSSIVKSELAEKRKLNDGNKNEENKKSKNIDTKAEIIKIKNTLVNEMNKFIVDNDKLVKDINQIFDKHADDDDIEEVEEEETDITYTCPYTGMSMKNDLIMKKYLFLIIYFYLLYIILIFIYLILYSTTCIHKLSKTCVDASMNKVKMSHLGFKCPISGCAKYWQKNNIENDVVMQTKMKSYYSSQTQSSQRRGGTFIDLDDDYTQL